MQLPVTCSVFACKSVFCISVSQVSSCAYRKAKIRWYAMAFSDVRGYRERVALIFEIITLSILMMLYIAAVLVIFLRLDNIGHNVNTS